VNKEIIQGKTQKGVGAAKDAMGRAVKSDRMQAEGKVDKAAGAVKEAAGKAKDAVHKATR